MPLGVQGWVNGWVRNNKQHVIFPKENERHRQDSTELTRSGHKKSRSSRKLDHGDNTTATAASTVKSNSSKMDPETKAIQRFNSRKKNRRLQRSISHSDLLREMAKAKEEEKETKGKSPPAAKNDDPKTAATPAALPSQAREPVRVAATAASKRHQNTNDNVHHQGNRRPVMADDDRSIADKSQTSTGGSLLWGLFGDDSSARSGQQKPHTKAPPGHQGQPPPPPHHHSSSSHDPHSSSSHHAVPPATTGKYLNETAFVQQYQQQKHKGSGSRTKDSQSVNRRNATESIDTSNHSNSPSRTGSKGAPSQRRSSYILQGGDAASISSSESGFGEVRQHSTRSANGYAGPLHAQPGFHAIHENNPRFLGAGPAVGGGHHECPSCEESEARLLAMRADMEYLRSIALRSEYLCAICENQSKRKKKHSKGNVPLGPDSTALNEASQRLMEVTARHKRQIEQMTRERSRWQQDMHIKLSKFATMCKHLNEESAIRNEEALALEAELFSTQLERNALATEVQQLRAEAVLHAKEKEEHSKLKAGIRKYQEDELNGANESLRQRDAIIEQLSKRLERTLDTLETERQQQRQRRQIIFPVARQQQPNGTAAPQSSPAGDAPQASPELIKLNDELIKAREGAKEAKLMLEAAQRAAEHKEQEMQDRIAKLEKQVKANETDPAI
mmetsp:Transcript_3428/g.4960  ORF Transcript_3428/g.4960 Transcript_3428/m.4960 type:complete len:674 (+) Transcript_3428:411-2432(+)